MRIAFATLGCRLNQFETDAMAGMARQAGYTPVSFDEEADLYVINTCTITHEADADSRQLIRRAVGRNPAARVIVTGCYAQAAPDRVAQIPGVDLVLGNVEKRDLLTYLGGPVNAAAPIIRVAEIRNRRPVSWLPTSVDADRTRVHLKVQDGCNYACAFCIVPQVRGRNRSQPPEVILREIVRLAETRYPEVVLTGIHLGTYGRDLSPPTSLAALCRRIEALPVPIRVRLSSVDPHEVTDDLVDFLGDSTKFCRHLHLPVQHGDDRILKLMRRRHTVADFARLVERLGREIPGIAIGSDVIVGFPGEGEAEFANTVRLLETLPITYLHVFSYSRRPGTAAATMPDQVPKTVKAARNRVLRCLAAEKNLGFRQGQLGRTLEVVVLDRRDPQAGGLEGLTDNYLRVFFDGEDGWRRRRVLVRAEAILPKGLGGTLITGTVGAGRA